MAVNPKATVITGIGELTTNTEEFGALNDAALVIENDRVSWIGPTATAPAADHRVDVGGRAVLPGWVDSHTHLVFAGDRTAEFGARMSGTPYSAGGIRTTVEATRAATDDTLAANLRRLRAEALRQGTTYLETKTGYGLTVADEKRCAVLAAEVADEVTFLGAHVVPPELSAADYLDLVCGVMLDAVAPHVRWIDVFCETGAFDAAQSARVLEAGRAAGLGLRVHGNQLAPGPGVQLAVQHGAASVDHCTHLTAADIDALAVSTTVATLLPACDLCTRQPLAPARRLLDAGARIALATNTNPGSSYTTSMAFCVTTAVLQMGLSLPEALYAATAGAAQSLAHDLTAPGAIGVLRPDSAADIHILDAPSAIHLAYRPGIPLTWSVWRHGKPVTGRHE
ncbi:imidazolonepropionase [Nocardia aurantiaca]|uniref:Imidazolonepropionase n=1 Tax=Nocardia aurantiaca TaxID=2675850 RepID=A0A6I3KY83_9NOCA|nr:imidazolonepropionase [Nocardia aurantiaca]MTE12469.1 imidazolonepropionase [Nocardia aurantiaca]